MQNVNKENFLIHPRLEQDSFFVTNLNLSQVRLINNQDYIWFILIPQINNITHLTDLTQEYQSILMHEINQVANVLTILYKPERLNIGMLGNIVEQMHWHIIVRYKTDKIWPNPVWGQIFNHYSFQQHNVIIQDFLNGLANLS